MTLALVTGATGMLGRALVQTALNAGADVRALVRPSSDVAWLATQPVELVFGQAGEHETLSRAVSGVELLFHAAGHLTANAPFELSLGRPLPAAYQQINVDFTQALLELGREAGVQRFVFASSASVYANAVPTPTPESAPVDPLSHYGRSKLLAENLLRAYCTDSMTGVIVRPSLIYGPGDRYFTPALLSLARLPFIPLIGGGDALLDMVYVQDVAQLMWRASQAQMPVTRAYNAGPGKPTSLRQLVDAYRDLTGRAPSIVPVSPKRLKWIVRLIGPPLRPFLGRLVPGADGLLTTRSIDMISHDMYLDMSRARDELQFEPGFTLRRGLERVLQGDSP